MEILACKVVIKWSLIVLVILKYFCHGQVKLEFLQTDYDVKTDIAEGSWYDTSYIKNLKVGFVPYNRTQRVYNHSFDLLVDLGSDITVHVQTYKMLSNEYRFFPITFSANVCAEYTKNSFSLKNLLIEFSNVNPCNMKKGFYYVKNALWDFSKCPPHIPRGSFKAVARYFLFRTPFMQTDWYMRVVDKPVGWNNSSKDRV